MNGLLALPREWVVAAGKIASFTSEVVRNVWGLRVLRFFGEALRQAGILILGSTLIIWGLVFITGLGTCGIEGAYFLESQGPLPTRAYSPPCATCARRCRTRLDT